MKTLMVVLAAVTMLAGKGSAQLKTKPNPGFEKLKTLAGEWQAKMPDGSTLPVTFKLVAADSVVEEDLPHGNMVTMYHADGANLMLTHYCAAGNQPRMRAAAFKDGDAKLVFRFRDATNMSDKNAEHMHSLTVTFKDTDHIQEEWQHFSGGKATGPVVIDLERVKS
jgi:hypothetical protein